MKQIYVIGVGGVGSWLAPAMALLVPESVVVIDGDKLEQKNLNRQLFGEEDVGRNKAEALGRRYDLRFIPKFYSHGSMSIDRTDWLLCAADNNLARKAALQSADEYGAQVIVGCNEKYSSEAYYYRRDWKGSPQDPRVYYSEIETDKSDDPRSAAIGCTGESQKQNVQLVTANYAAAGHMMSLYIAWAMERVKLNKEAATHLPHRIRQSLTRFEIGSLAKPMK